jgi:PAS domain S-box-containing protein
MSIDEVALSPAATPPHCGDARSFLEVPPPFLEMLPTAIYACDAEGRIRWFNRRAAELWGRAPRIGNDCELFCGSYRLHGLDGTPIDRAQTPMAQVLRTGDPVHGTEAWLERPDGTRILAVVHIDPVKDAGGKVVGAINCFQETTELHRMNEQLGRNQQDLEDFFENGAVALHIVANDGTILRANKAELDLLGYEPEEYLGHHIAEFHADQDVIDDILARLGRGEKLDKYPARLRAKDGSLKDVFIISNVQFQEGRFLNTRCFTLDVTEWKRAQEQVHESERRFGQLLEALPAAVYTTDAEGRITFYNQAAVEFSGRRPELGSDRWCVSWRLLWPDGTPMAHDECPMAVALKEDRVVRGEEALAERPDGTRVPFIAYPTTLRDASGRFICAVNMLVDITERKHAEARQKVLLDELNHRVKNNMQMLHALLQAARRETVSVEARAVLADAGQRVAAMAAAQQVLYDAEHPADFDAKDFLEAVCGAALQAFGRNVSIALERAAGKLSNDAAMPLALILNDLLTNAVKHGARGRGSIRVGLERIGDSFALYVEDDGPGFELDHVRRRSSGLGLVSGLTRQLDGSFEVERAGGARCLVRFPGRSAAPS